MKLCSFLGNPKAITEDNAKKAAVLIPLIIKEKEREEEIKRGLEKGLFSPEDYELLFEIRSSKLDTQPGDICFPGGLIGIKGADSSGQAINETPPEAAVRECCEELFVSESQIEIFGPSDYFHRGNLVIYPFIGLLKDYDGRFNKDEVSETFTVPLSFFFDNKPCGHIMEWVQKIPEDFPTDKIYGGKNYRFRNQVEEQFFWEYEDKVIWGISAKMLRAFVNNIKSNEKAKTIEK